MTETEAQTVNAEVANIAPPAPLIEPTDHPNGDGFLFLYREGYRVEKVEGPKVQKRTHVFHDIPSFAEYLKRHADPKLVEILVDAEKIVAALDPKSPIGDVVTCELVKDPRYLAWHSHLQKGLTQRAMFQLIRSQRADLDPQVSQMLLGSLQSLKLAEGGEINMDIDERGMNTFAATTAKRNLSGQIPPIFVAHIPVFDGVHRVGEVSNLPVELAIYDLEIYLTVDADKENGVLFTLSAPSRESIVRQARRDAAAFLVNLLGEGFLVGLGAYHGSVVPAYKAQS